MPLVAGTRYLDYATARERMAQIVIEASRDPQIISIALEQVSSVAVGDYPSEAAALAEIARDCIRYTGDVSGEDLYKWPLLTLQQQAGDCNNKVVLFASLARAIGFPVQLCFLFNLAEGQTVPDLAAGDFPVHVFASVDVYKGEREVEQWVPVELTPIPDQVSGYPTYAVPFGSLPSTAGRYVDCVDVDSMMGAVNA